MKALYIQNHGELDEIRFGDAPTPIVGSGHVRVRMRAAALNRLDLFVLAGIPGLEISKPHILGADGAGEVESVGNGVRRFRSGDRVMLNPVLSCEDCEFCLQGEQSLCIRMGLVGEHSAGTFAEYFVVPDRNLEPIPGEVSFEEAAAFSLVFQTAWRMLTRRARVAPAADVLIHGIGGGVSSAALAIVKLCGGRAFVTSSSEEKLEKARRLGADFTFNYTQIDVVREVARITAKRGVDIVVDNVGAATWLDSLKLARKGGTVVTCGATTGPNPTTEIRLIFWKQLQILGSTMGSRYEYRELIRFLESGQLKPMIDKVFPLSEGRLALEYLQANRQFGKVVLRLD